MVTELTIIGQSKLAINLANQFEAAKLPLQLLKRDDKGIEGKFLLFTLPYEDMISLIYHNQDYLAQKVIIDMSPSLQHADQTGPAHAMQSTALGLADRFSQLLTSAGWQVLDMGSLYKSPGLEAFARVQNTLSET